MVLMHDAPLFVLFSEPYGQTKVELHTLTAAGVTAPADRRRERHVRPRHYRNVPKLEHHRFRLPLEESLPRGHVLLDPPRYEQGRNVEHQHVRVVVRADAFDVLIAYRLGPEVEDG